MQAFASYVGSGGSPQTKKRMKYNSRSLASLGVGFLSLFAIICPSAQAVYFVTLEQIGPNIVATGHGSLDLTALINPTTTPPIAAQVFPNACQPVCAGIVVVGPSSPGEPATSYFGLAGSALGSGLFASFADSGEGPIVGFNAATGVLLVPVGYVSGAPLGTSTAIWNNATFTDLGLDPGTTQEYSWGNGEQFLPPVPGHADRFLVKVGGPFPAAENGNTILLLLGAVGMLAAYRSKLKHS
jgi:hypothetical protein